MTKRGKLVAKVVPADEAEPVSLEGSVLWHGDIISPIDVEWEALVTKDPHCRVLKRIRTLW